MTTADHRLTAIPHTPTATPNPPDRQHPTRPADRPLLTLREVADHLQVPPKTLYAWRHKGDGPVGIRVGRHLRYRPEDVERWLDERARASLNLRAGLGGAHRW